MKKIIEISFSVIRIIVFIYLAFYYYNFYSITTGIMMTTSVLLFLLSFFIKELEDALVLIIRGILVASTTIFVVLSVVGLKTLQPLIYMAVLAIEVYIIYKQFKKFNNEKT